MIICCRCGTVKHEKRSMNRRWAYSAMGPAGWWHLCEGPGVELSHIMNYGEDNYGAGVRDHTYRKRWRSVNMFDSKTWPDKW